MAARGQNQGKGKHKLAYAPKPKILPPPKWEDLAKDSICHECGEIGHWKRNCPQFLAELLKKKKNAASGAGGSGIFVIEVNTFLNRSWIYDTGCGTHICNTTQGLRASRKLKPGALSLYIGNGQREAVEAIGFFIYEDGFINRFVNNTIQVSRNNMVYFSAIPKDGIFEIDLSNSYANESSIYTVSNKRAKIDLDSALLWHCRLGHISKKRIEKLQHDGLLNSTDLRAFEKCVPCMFGKMARKPYTHQVERAKDLLGLIHTDVCGPFKIMSRQGASYFVTFTDDFSRYGYVYLLKHKHEVFETFKVFQKEVENQLGKTIKSLRFDREGEYVSQEFLDHLKDHGIIAYRTPPYTPQHNGVLERRNRTLLDMVRSMMSQTTLSKSFWDYALETAARILNMVPTKKVEKTPYEVWHGQAPKLSYLKVWGCEVLVKRDTLTKPDKLESRSIKCIFIGYPKETTGYSFYYPPENKVLVARNAEFLENILITQEASGSLEDLEIIQEEDTHPSIDISLNHEEDDLEIDEPQSDINPIRRPTRTCRPRDRLCLYIDAEEHKLGDLGEPANYKAALLDPKSDKWINAMNVEMQYMKDNEVWDLVDLPPNGKTVGGKWLFKKKTDMDEAVHTYKARLVAKGYTQTPRIDYEETFYPIAYIRAIRILIVIAAYYDYEI
ncbi:retrotransposon protein, putative, ty1-copia subclass [Tanacetum coccineum]